MPDSVAVPESAAVALPLSWKVTPLGSEPDSVRVGTGVPVAVTVKLPAVPAVKVVPLALLIMGATGAGLTLRVKLCVASGPDPLWAVIVRGNDPVVDAVPLRAADPLPLSLKLTPLGNEPLSLSEGVGVPVVVTVKLATEPAVKVVLVALVIAGAMGAGLTVSVKFWMASGPEPLWAVIVNG